jgi:hypothetical protein
MRLGLTIAGMLLFGVLAVAWWLTAPLFIRYSVHEPSPLAAPGAEAQVLRRGSFTGKDAAHQGSGQAILARMGGAETILRLEEFSVTNGPDLRVFLSANPAPHDDATVREGAVELGPLRAPEGSFQYRVPAGYDASAARSVVIYCVPFRFVFATAALE